MHQTAITTARHKGHSMQVSRFDSWRATREGHWRAFATGTASSCRLFPVCYCILHGFVSNHFGLVLTQSAFWGLPKFTVFKALAVDSLHQLDIGVFGRYLMGALKETLDTNGRKVLGDRLRNLSKYSAKPLRIPKSVKAMDHSTGHEWRSLSGVRVARRFPCQPPCTDPIRLCIFGGSLHVV